MVACVLEQHRTIEATAERFQVDAKSVRKWRDPPASMRRL
jgi:transposase-like protein